jgi:hypothetical protein
MDSYRLAGRPAADMTNWPNRQSAHSVSFRYLPKEAAADKCTAGQQPKPVITGEAGSAPAAAAASSIFRLVKA